MKELKRTWQLWLFVLPGLIYFLVFKYYPIYGSQIAFKDFSPWLGFWDSPWVGLENFKRFFSSPDFMTILKNTLIINIAQLVIGFPCPIILAVLINEINGKKLKKMIQTITYAPYFISTVVLVGMMSTMLSPYNGVINIIIQKLGGDAVFFMGDSKLYLWLYVFSGIWQSCGYSAIVYIAALSSIDAQMHEAARVDGASRLQRILYIDIPGIMPTIMTMLILQAGRLLMLGFEKSYLMQNALNAGVSEVIATYTYKRGIIGGDFSYSTAIEMFQSVISFIILILVNKLCKKYNDTSLW